MSHTEWDEGWEAGYDSISEEMKYLKEEVESLRQENEALNNLLAARVRCDKLLPDDQQKFVEDFMSKYENTNTDTRHIQDSKPR